MHREHPGWSLFGLGVLFLGVAGLSFVVDDSPWLVKTFGVTVPVVLGVALVGLGYLAGVRWQGSARPVRIAAWTVAGGLAGLAINFWFIALISISSERLGEGGMLLLNGVAIGASFGTVIGYYHSGTVEQTRIIEKQDERLDEFSRVISHEIRNPLTVAQGNMRLYRSTGDEAHFEAAMARLERIDRLLPQMLYLTWPDRTEFELDTVELGQVVRQASRNLSPDDLDIEVETDRLINADPGLLRTMFETLFRMAREADGATGPIRVGSLPSPGDFFVEGPGFSPIFERPEPLLELAPPGNGGYELDLSIIRRLIEEHGWNLSVEESEDGSSRVDVTGVTPAS